MIMRTSYNYPPFSKDILHMGHFVLFQNDGSWAGKQIVKEQKEEGYEDWQAQFTHTAVIGRGLEIIEATWPHSCVSNIVEKYPGRFVRICRFDYPDYETKHRYDVAWAAATRNNLPYGLVSILYWKLNDYFPWTHNFLAKPQKPFCSYLAAWALIQVIPDAEKIIGKSAGDFMPATFADRFFLPVWEGFLPKGN